MKGCFLVGQHFLSLGIFPGFYITLIRRIQLFQSSCRKQKLIRTPNYPTCCMNVMHDCTQHESEWDWSRNESSLAVAKFIFCLRRQNCKNFRIIFCWKFEMYRIGVEQNQILKSVRSMCTIESQSKIVLCTKSNKNLLLVNWLQTLLYMWHLELMITK